MLQRLTVLSPVLMALLGGHVIAADAPNPAPDEQTTESNQDTGEPVDAAPADAPAQIWGVDGNAGRFSQMRTTLASFSIPTLA